MSFTPRVNPLLRHDIPASFAKAIGRIVVRWAYLESLLQQTIYDLVGIDSKLRKLVIVEKRAQDQIDLIQDITIVLDLTLPTKNEIRDLRKILEESKRERDLLCHGTWINDDLGWCVADYRGKWSKDDLPELDRVPRKAIPRGVHMDTQRLTKLDERIKLAIQGAGKLRTHLVTQLPSSREKR